MRLISINCEQEKKEEEDEENNIHSGQSAGLELKPQQEWLLLMIALSSARDRLVDCNRYSWSLCKENRDW